MAKFPRSSASGRDAIRARLGQARPSRDLFALAFARPLSGARERGGKAAGGSTRKIHEEQRNRERARRNSRSASGFKGKASGDTERVAQLKRAIEVAQSRRATEQRLTPVEEQARCGQEARKAHVQLHGRQALQQQAIYLRIGPCQGSKRPGISKVIRECGVVTNARSRIVA